jgi:HAD superfamily hydrolase (TIGR01509 family)
MTTPPVDDPETLRRILSQAEALFLDFDGPVCNIFAGMPASAVVDQLCVVLADGGYGDPPPDIEKSSDPFDVLKYAATLGETEAEYVNAAFTAHEVEAIATAEPTPGGHELIRAWSKTSRPLAIVSNNSALAVYAYLDLHNLRTHVTHVSARRKPNPALLKPNPYLLTEALTELSVPAKTVVFVGDSVTDIEASKLAGINSVGYANKPGKVEMLADVGAQVLTTTISIMLTTVTGS